jgi:hypothetical protein
MFTTWPRPQCPIGRTEVIIFRGMTSKMISRWQSLVHSMAPSSVAALDKGWQRPKRAFDLPFPPFLLVEVTGLEPATSTLRT